ncbi:MAG TPA: hypothetical protein PKE31_08160 [Pseudomonadota bacterium]|nr:hypothetical protein [Pseudomonadota bacterium]
MAKYDQKVSAPVFDPPKQATPKHSEHKPASPLSPVAGVRQGAANAAENIQRHLPYFPALPFPHFGDDAKPSPSAAAPIEGAAKAAAKIAEAIGPKTVSTGPLPTADANEGAEKGAAKIGASLGVQTGVKSQEISRGAASTELGGVLSGKDLMCRRFPDEDLLSEGPRDPKADAEVTHAKEVRDQLVTQMAEMKDVTPEQQAMILERTQGLTGDALVAEMKFLENALKTPNADRALNAYADLSTMIAENPEAAERLTPDMMGMLVTGVANPRTDSDRGQAGVLGGKQVRDAAEALLTMSQSDYDKLSDALGNAGKDDKGKAVAGADAAAEQALVLKALAARKELLLDHEPGPDGLSKADLAMEELTGFAKDIRGEKRADLIRTTTALDIDDTNTNTTNPTTLDKPGEDTKTDNDGLFQRFTTTCGPTTAQMVAAEYDPIYARRLHDEGFNNADPTTATSRQQQETLENNGGNAVSRLGNKATTAANTGLNAAEASNSITHDERMAVERYLYYRSNPKPEDLAAINASLEKVRAENGGHPTEAEVNAIRYNAGKDNKTGEGMYLPPALNAIASDAANDDFSQLGVNYNDMADRLKDGQPVPIRNESWGGHFMMVSDVRGEGKDQKFLVSDPWTGATRWMTAAQMKNGDFDDVFGIPAGGITTMYGDKEFEANS